MCYFVCRLCPAYNVLSSMKHLLCYDYNNITWRYNSSYFSSPSVGFSYYFYWAVPARSTPVGSNYISLLPSGVMQDIAGRALFVFLCRHLVTGPVFDVLWICGTKIFTTAVWKKGVPADIRLYINIQCIMMMYSIIELSCPPSGHNTRKTSITAHCKNSFLCCHMANIWGIHKPYWHLDMARTTNSFIVYTSTTWWGPIFRFEFDRCRHCCPTRYTVTAGESCYVTRI